MADLKGLNEKYGPLPLWMWGLGSAVVGVLYLMHKKNAAANAQQGSTQAAADQTNSNLGSASQLANLFEVAGLMPYQGGDTYVNVTGQQPGSGAHGHPIINGGHPPFGTPQPVSSTTGSSIPPAVGTISVFEWQAQQKDTWASLANRFGLSTTQLQQFNANASNRGNLGSINTSAPLKPGERVVIPWLNQ